MATYTQKSDAQYSHSIDSFNTPFTPLEGDVASYGLRVDVCEPHATYSWSGGTSFIGDLQAAAASAVQGVFVNAAKATQIISDGRAPNVLEYWSAGAPLWYGAGQRGRVAIHYGCKLRPVVGRSWFSASSSVTFSLALAGSGYVRCTKTVSGTTTNVLTNGTPGFQLTEADWLDQGYRFTEVLTLAPGDSIDIYYIQNLDRWGGLVAKVVEGTVQTQELGTLGPVLGCGLFDTGTQPPIQSWKHIEEFQVRVENQQAPQADISLPLINPARHDGFGWEWRKDSDDDPGYLVCWDGGVVQFELRRGRLVRIKAGYKNEEEKLFTGIVQDIPTPVDGTAQISCIGFEYRLLECRNKLEPDPISYMTFGYRKQNGVSEPVYGITAYDAWTMEDAVADSVLRSGVDASRLLQPLKVKKADGTFATVVYGSETFRKMRARSKSISFDYLKIRGTSTGAGYAYKQIGGAVGYVIQANDFLEYDVWQDTKNPQFTTGVDFKTASGRFHASLIVDQNTLSGALTTDLGAVSKGKWYRRRFNIGASLAGETISTWALGLEGDIAGNYEVRFANVRIRNAGVVKKVLYETGNVTTTNWAEVASNPTNYTNTAVTSVLQTGAPLHLERPAHYGNVGTQFSEIKPVDDPYIFVPEAKDDSWARVLELADRYGYDIRFDAVGDLVLSTRVNACYAYDIEEQDGSVLGSRQIHPSAYRGTYTQWSAATIVTKRVRGARIEVSIPRGPGLSAWASIVVRKASDSSIVATISSVATTAPSDVYYYDYVTDITGVNATSLLLYSGDFDDYIVEFTGTGAGTRRLDTLFVYHTDPLLPKFALSTLRNALHVSARNVGDEMRNMVTVVGKRKATTTDSLKFQTNPNNADPEFIVEAAVDAASISDPTAPNYVGMRRESTIIDSKIADQDYAAYLARTFVYRYRTPKPPADIPHTLIAELALRVPVSAEEAMFKSVTPQSTLWVTGYRHTVRATGEYATDISTAAWPEFPSFEPRDDIDIDADFNGVPVTNVAVSYMGCSGVLKTNLPSSGLVLESGTGDVDTWGVAVAVTGSPEYLDMAGKPWPPVPGTVSIRPSSAGGGTTSANEEWPGGGAPIPTPNSSSALYKLNPGLNTLKINLTGSAKTITSIQAVTWTATESSILANPNIDALWDFMRTVQTTVAPSDYSYDPIENLLTVRVSTNAATNILRKQRLSIKVSYNKFTSSSVAKWHANSPYHHFMNVDYRDSNRKIYLPWAQGDGTGGFTRSSTAVTNYDVRYRKLGDVDPTTKAYVPHYGSGSPFFDVTTSELGYLVSLSCDVLVSGLYRISVRSVYDDTIVAYMTEPGADPKNPESHWQFLTAGRARSWNWDGVDQIGVWNKKQSDDYAALSQGWFESESKEAIGANWYVWNREFQGGAYAPLALISDERNADGTPTYGQGTYAQWYFHFECKNELIAQRADEDGNAYPRVVRTIEPKQNEVAPVYSTGPGTNAAIVYTHTPAPAQLELEIADWKEAYAYDPSDSGHLDDSHWTAPWYNVDLGAPSTFEGLINNQAPVRTRFRVAPRAGYLWLGQGDEAEIKLTRHVHLKAQVFDQVAVGEGTNWVTSTGDTGVEQKTIYNRSFHNDDHTLVFTDEGWRKARTLKNSQNLGGTTEWVFRPEDFKKDFGRGNVESLLFGDYLQLEEVPKWEQHRSVASPHSRMLLAFSAYLFYLSAYCVDRTGRRTWGINRKFVDRYKIAHNTYGHWWDPANPTTAATNLTYQAELPYDPTKQQRRTVICRQWSISNTTEAYSDVAQWRTAQKALWSFATGSPGDKLLRHKWQDHEPTATTLNGIAWPTLFEDKHSKWHRDGRTQLPAQFASLTRQLGDASSTSLGTWTWETAPKWVPCITRDFHSYFRMPPMAAPSNANTLATANIYGIVDTTTPDLAANTGQDAARSQTWSSWARDMTETYAQNNAGKVRFSPGTKTNPITDAVTAKSLDYVRQDDCAHFEDLRGIYTRSQRPAEAAVKVVPTRPYYINMMGYDQSSAARARGMAPEMPIPLFSVRVAEWFRLSFRTEYLWESSTFFPVDSQNRERLEQMNVGKSRFMGNEPFTGPQQVLYDAGAWTGWKDDLSSGSALFQNTVFDSGFMPFTLGPEQGPTADIYVHLILVNERRQTPV
jgi:hypothetical protein